ncbi:hypothetical protein ASE75_12965 [Sphingomonas sp. Leaf17]|nr:hypothetical protein ASE75_12965 [Sphingomonas sp. Leaf17]
MLSLVLMSVIYWIAAAFGFFLLALRSCGMAPDSVEMCDLTPIRIYVAVALIGYVGWAAPISFRFLRFR